MVNSLSLGVLKSRLYFFLKYIRELSETLSMCKADVHEGRFSSPSFTGCRSDYQIIKMIPSGLNKGVSLNKKLQKKKKRHPRQEASFMNLRKMASKFMSWGKLQHYSKSTNKPLTRKLEKIRSQCQSLRQERAAKPRWIPFNLKNMKAKGWLFFFLFFNDLSSTS